MKVTVLAENTTCRGDLRPEHGLSLFIETGDQKILFDAGQSGAFAYNAEVLGIDLQKTDFAILSHGHYDHGGGLIRFRQINSTAPIYLHPAAFGAHYHGADRYIGLDPALAHCPGLICTQDEYPIAEKITLYTCNTQAKLYPVDHFGITKVENEKHVSDPFSHEQYLLIEENGKRICFSGCSHKGIINIVHWLQPDVLIGGFHLSAIDPQTQGSCLEETARTLLSFPAEYYTGHCTGQSQFLLLQQIMGSRLHGISTGSVLTL